MESIQMVLLMLAASALCCDATSEPLPITDSALKAGLLRRLIGGSWYDTDVEPPATTGEITNVSLGINIQCAKPEGDNGDSVRIQGWMALMWKDARLSWDPSQYNGIAVLRVSEKRIWKPDVHLYNAGYMYWDETKAMLHSGGTVIWVPQPTFYIPCQHQQGDAITNCTMKIGSWSYTVDVLDIQPSLPGFVESNHLYSEACPLVVKSHEARRNEKYYDCCPDERYLDIEISLALTSR